jgi:HlyD family secretion protein
MLRVADMNLIELRVDVGENDIPKVHLGDSAIIEVDAYSKRKFKGLVTKIASSNTGAAQAGQLSSSTEVTNYKVHIRLLPETYKDLFDPTKPKSFPFRPGMNASADIQTKTHANVLAVPINAVTTREKNGNNPKANGKDEKSDEGDEMPATTGDDEIEEVVFVLQKDNTVKKVKVRTDIQDINHIEILAGLKAGDEVITGPYNIVSKTLKEGDKVKIIPKEKLFTEKKE